MLESKSLNTIAGCKNGFYASIGLVRPNMI
jgi:hypothetical protein